MLPIKFQVHWPFGSGEEAKNFQDGHHGSPWISDQKDFSFFFYLQVIPMLPTKFQVKWPFVQEKKQNIDFQDGHLNGNPGFQIGTILAIFDLLVIPMLPTEFQAIWPFGSGEEVKNRFSRSWMSDQNDFSYFRSTSHPIAFQQVSRQLAFWFRRSEK